MIRMMNHGAFSWFHGNARHIREASVTTRRPRPRSSSVRHFFRLRFLDDVTTVIVGAAPHHQHPPAAALVPCDGAGVPPPPVYAAQRVGPRHPRHARTPGIALPAVRGSGWLRSRACRAPLTATGGGGPATPAGDSDDGSNIRTQMMSRTRASAWRSRGFVVDLPLTEKKPTTGQVI